MVAVVELGPGSRLRVEPGREVQGCSGHRDEDCRWYRLGADGELHSRPIAKGERGMASRERDAQEAI